MSLASAADAYSNISVMAAQNRMERLGEPARVHALYASLDGIGYRHRAAGDLGVQRSTMRPSTCTTPLPLFSG